MTGEVSLDGVFFPALLLLSIVALVLTFGTIRLINYLGLYRFVAYRALVDLCLFIFILGLLTWATSISGISL